MKRSRVLSMAMLLVLTACGAGDDEANDGSEPAVTRESMREEALRRDAGLFAAQAFREMAAGNYAQASITARRAVQADAWHPSAQHALAWAAIHEGNSTLQVIAALEAVRLAPDSAHFRRTLGIAMSGAGRRRDAVRAFREAVRLNPTDSLSWRDLGRAAYAIGSWALADSAFDRLGELDPAHFDTADAAARAEAGRRSP